MESPIKNLWSNFIMEKKWKKKCLFIFTNIITKQWGYYPNQGVGGQLLLVPPPLRIFRSSYDPGLGQHTQQQMITWLCQVIVVGIIPRHKDIKGTITSTLPAKNVLFSVKFSGLVETAPKEVEGWFTSKVKLLRQLSEASGHLTKSSSNNSTSPNSSRSGSMQKKTTKKSSKGHRVPVKAF